MREKEQDRRRRGRTFPDRVFLLVISLWNEIEGHVSPFLFFSSLLLSVKG